MSKSIRKAFIASIPVMAGYIVLGIGFGLLSIIAGTVVYMMLIRFMV